MDPIVLSADKVSPAARDLVASFHRSVIEEVERAVQRDRVVVVGMAQNPFVKKARQLLEAEGVRFTYLEYGSYLSGWKVRLALKLWARFPTFPMVFVEGTLVGGHAELVRLRDDGGLKALR
ncbi:MAG: glutaredoxin [Myxococcales bacterium]|nr:MAG: glutaredoxin [Myxococcales bacterium]